MLKNDQKCFKNDQTMFGHFPTLYIKGLKDYLKRKSKEKNWLMPKKEINVYLRFDNFIPKIKPTQSIFMETHKKITSSGKFHF